MELNEFATEEYIAYSSGEEQAKLSLEVINSTIQIRKEAFDASDKSLTPRVFYGKMKPIYIVIDDIDNFVDIIKKAKEEKTITEAQLVGITLIGSNLSSRLRGFDEITKLFKESLAGIILGHPSEQLVWTIEGMRKYKPAPDGALFYNRGQIKEIKVPRID